MVDLRVRDGVVAEVWTPGARSTDADIDAGGALVLPQLAEPHSHLDRILAAADTGQPPGLESAIAWWRELREKLDANEVTSRASRGLARLRRHGVRRVRTHVDVAAVTAGAALQGVLAADGELEGIELQAVAFAGTPLTGRAGHDNRAALRAAVADGAHLVGGAPYRDPAPAEALDTLLSVAGDAACGIDVHVDESTDPAVSSLDTLVDLVESRDFPYAVTASHCVSLAFRSPAEQRRLAARLAAAGIAVVTLPATNLYLQGRGHPGGSGSAPRGLTALEALAEQGVLVAAGADNVEDPFCPVNSGDPRETARLLVLAGHLAPGDAFDMVSARAAQVLGLSRPGPHAGATAALMLVDAPSVRAFVAGQGRIVAHLEEAAADAGKD